MKVGDVVERDCRFGFVTECGDDRICVTYHHFLEVCVREYAGTVVNLTAKQRAFVNAAIAAEALRRIG